MKLAVEEAGRFTPLFIADWRDAFFVHFRIDPTELQSLVPMDLDIYGGHAYISLVAFTQVGLRPIHGGKIARLLGTPLATHDFLNVRTYVRHGKERGIFFLSEWIPNRLAVLLGPRLYGLPYRFGQLNYHTDLNGLLIREARCSAGSLTCVASVDSTAVARICAEGSESHFLLERYTAFTCRRNVIRRFRIRHDPWLQTPASVTFGHRGLLKGFVTGDPSASHFSAGVNDVAIGRPERNNTGLRTAQHRAEDSPALKERREVEHDHSEPSLF